MWDGRAGTDTHLAQFVRSTDWRPGGRQAAPCCAALRRVAARVAHMGNGSARNDLQRPLGTSPGGPRARLSPICHAPPPPPTPSFRDTPDHSRTLPLSNHHGRGFRRSGHSSSSVLLQAASVGAALRTSPPRGRKDEREGWDGRAGTDTHLAHFVRSTDWRAGGKARRGAAQHGAAARRGAAPHGAARRSTARRRATPPHCTALRSTAPRRAVSSCALSALPTR
eukprot:gene3986-biopygen20366